ncbi:MAG: hypothetical protein R3A45_02990 [Bdellovibrionota bacterium]
MSPLRSHCPLMTARRMMILIHSRIKTVTATVIDDDSAGFIMTESGGKASLGENAGTDTFGVDTCNHLQMWSLMSAPVTSSDLFQAAH